MQEVYIAAAECVKGSPRWWKQWLPYTSALFCKNNSFPFTFFSAYPNHNLLRASWLGGRFLSLPRYKYDDLWQPVASQKGISLSPSPKIRQMTAWRILILQMSFSCIFIMKKWLKLITREEKLWLIVIFCLKNEIINQGVSCFEELGVFLCQ